MLNSDFNLVCHNANLTEPEKGDIGSLRIDSPIGPGVYFWTMNLESVTYKIYIGKTKSLQRRVSDYIRPRRRSGLGSKPSIGEDSKNG